MVERADNRYLQAVIYGGGGSGSFHLFNLLLLYLLHVEVCDERRDGGGGGRGGGVRRGIAGTDMIFYGDWKTDAQLL